MLDNVVVVVVVAVVELLSKEMVVEVSISVVAVVVGKVGCRQLVSWHSESSFSDDVAAVADDDVVDQGMDEVWSSSLSCISFFFSRMIHCQTCPEHWDPEPSSYLK